MFVSFVAILLLVQGCRATDPSLNQGLLERIEALERESERNRELESQLQKHELYINQLERTVVSQSGEIAALKEEVLSLRQREERTSGIGRQSKGTKHGNSHILAASPLVQQPGIARRARSTGEIAFTAYLDHDIPSLGPHQTVIFNKVITNEGTMYNIHTGMFVCPEAGMYLFSFSIGALGARQSVARLMVDGVNKIDSIADPQHGGHDAQGGNTVILRLKPGESVWIESLYSTAYIHSLDGARFSSFTGVLL